MATFAPHLHRRSSIHPFWLGTLEWIHILKRFESIAGSFSALCKRPLLIIIVTINIAIEIERKRGRGSVQTKLQESRLSSDNDLISFSFSRQTHRNGNNNNDHGLEGGVCFHYSQRFCLELNFLLHIHSLYHYMKWNVFIILSWAQFVATCGPKNANCL